MPKRPVYIFSGKSCLCKSHIAACTGKTMYETDSSSKLPDVLYDEIIVIGNKYKYDMKDIEDRIYNKQQCKIIKVKFEE